MNKFFPGATEELMQPILEASGLRVGKDFILPFLRSVLIREISGIQLRMYRK